MNSILKLGLVVGAIFVLILGLMLVKIRTVQGNEIGVLETWADGVSSEPLVPKTYVFMPGFNKTVYTYTTSGQVFAMNDIAEPFAEGRRVDVLEVNSLDNQKVQFHITVTWRIDPTKVVALHKNYRNNIEERLIRPEVVNEVGIRATLQNAIDLYSGEKLNALRKTVTEELRAPTGKLASSGIIVDRFVIEKPKLNPEYEKVIEARQLAIATESQAREQKKANDAIAEAARSAALKQQYEQVVAAETAKQTAILQQQASSEQDIIRFAANAKNTVVTQEAEAKKITIAAQAERDRNVLIAEGEKTAALNRAQAIEALGAAEASAQKLKYSAYAVPGADNFVRIQVAASMATAFQNIKGYLPEKMSVNLLAEQYSKGVSMLVGGDKPTTALTFDQLNATKSGSN